ncbi:MAG: aminopeptidase [Candidatus Asgardarchaeia archaeon]
MINEKTIEDIAKISVNALALKEGEHIVINSGIHNHILAEKIALEAFVRGAYPVVIPYSDDFFLELYSKVPDKYLKHTPKHLFELIKNSDAYVVIERTKDPSTTLKYPPDKVQAYQEGMYPIREHILTKLKWLYLGYPTEEAAKFFGISYNELERLIIGGILIDYDDLQKKCKTLEALLKDAVEVHITDDYGTDLKLKVEGRRINLDDGIISEEDIKIGDLGLNLPAGEVFIAPHEEVGEGMLFVPLTRERFTGHFIRNALLVFENGQLNIERSTAEEGFEYLKQALEKSMEIDKKRFGEAKRTLNFAELGIGLNPNIDKPIGYILTDEKIGGSIHIAIGENRGYGGTSASSLHWDFVSAPKETIDVLYKNGEQKRIMEDGQLIT